MRDAKPKRKVAVPLPEGCSWGAFMQQVMSPSLKGRAKKPQLILPLLAAELLPSSHEQVQTKLKLAAVDSIYLASSGERVTSLDQLQDIDELHAVEV